MPQTRSPSTTWGAMRAGSSSTSPAPSNSSASPQGPLWKARGQHIHRPTPEADAFPALGLASTINSSGGSTAAGAASQHGQHTNSPAQAANHHPQHQQQGQQQRRKRQDKNQNIGTAAASHGLLRRRSLSAPSLAEAASGCTSVQRQPQQPYSAVAATVSGSKSAGNSRSSSVEKRHSNHHHRHQQQQQQQHWIPQHNNSAVQQPQPQQQQQQQQQVKPVTGLQLLQECHPWCDAVLLHEVLQTFEGDVAAALAALQQMLPADSAGRQQQQQQLSIDSNSGSDGSSSDSSSAGGAAADGSGGRARTAAAVQGRSSQLWPAGPEEDSQGADVPQQQLAQLQLSEQQQRKQHQQQQQQGVEQDTYRALRGDAVKLSHQYRKASRRAAAARARGDYSAAAQLASEAVSLKAAADAAHAAAALKIEVANNADNPDGLWELDLHGLHVSEALQALQERVQLLQDIAGDVRKQMPAQQQPNHMQSAQHMKQHGTPTGGINSAAASSKKQAVLKSLLLPENEVLSWEQQLAAMRQELRVIVGKGLHSSGGEASLPRVVEQWLMQHGYRYVWRGGCIGVSLKLL